MTNLNRTVNLIASYIIAENDQERAKVVADLRRVIGSGQISSSGCLEEDVEELLVHLGIPSHLRGFEYLATAICAVVRSPRMMKYVMKELYPHVAKVHGVIVSRVERAMRHAIEVAFDRCDGDILVQYFGNSVSPSKGVPTNSEFISCLAKTMTRGGGNYEMDKLS